MKPWSNLSKIVTRRTYNRNDNGHTESWEETVRRVIEGNVRGFNVSTDEIKRLHTFLLERKAMPAGRGLWFSGAPAHSRLGGAALVNCWGTTADDWENFVMAQDLLMLGGGVGLSVEHRFVSKLSKIRSNVNIVHKPTKDADFIVPDSREGWNELTFRALESYFETGKSFSFSTICVREYGQPIKGFGGTSSGAGPLIKFIENLSTILSQREGMHVRPIDAADIMCSIGELVVSGNVRRSAILILGDPWDKEYLKSKRWDLAPLPSYRAMANYSVVCDDVEDLHPSFWKTYEVGEAFGIFNRKNVQAYGRFGEKKKDTAMVCNPCITKDMFVTTGKGLRTVESLIHTPFWAIQNGKGYQSYGFWKTGTKPVYKITTKCGYELKATKDHLIKKPNGEFNKLCELRVGDKVAINDARREIEIDKEQFRWGWVIGELVEDGHYNKDSELSGLAFWGETAYEMSKYAHMVVSSLPITYWREYQSDGPTYHKTSDKWIKVSKKIGRFCEKYVDEDKNILPSLEQASVSLVAGFLRGMFDSDGSIGGDTKGHGIYLELSQSNLSRLKSIQRMLLQFGIFSRIYPSKDAGYKKLPDGHGGSKEYFCQKNYKLAIGRDSVEVFAKYINFKDPVKRKMLAQLIESKEKSSYKTRFEAEIDSIDYVGEQEVFDCNIDGIHSFDANGIIVHNCGEATLEDGEPCNLQEIFLPNLEGAEEFKEAAVLMHRWGKRVTCEKFHNPKNDEVIKRNRRIGTGITGCLQAPNLFKADVLDDVYQAIQRENSRYSKELHIPESIRTTVVKPSGTLSLLGDATPGVHPAFSRYYIRRIRFASNDPLIKVLQKAGYNIEPVKKFDGKLDHVTLVVDFYCETPADTPCADAGFDTWKQLDTLLFAQKHWADQAVSITVYYKRDEIVQIKQWLAQNIKNIKTISFLCYSDHGFEQSPMESITKQDYETLSSKTKDIEFDDVSFGDLESMECDGGTCPIK